MHPLLSQPYTVTLLGGLQLQHGDRRITRFHTYKIGALLAYLVYYPRPHARELLVEIFWPEGTPDRQRNNLSIALSSLRNQLEPPAIPAGAVIVADRHRVGVNAVTVQTDVLAFDQAFQIASTTQNERQRAIRLQEAVELYRGELLPGYYEDWIFAERQRLAEQYVLALRRLIRLLVKQKQISQAIDYNLRLIAAEPLREEAYRDLMKLYVADGQPSAALQQFRDLERLLERNFEEAPSAATRQMASEIQTLVQTSSSTLPVSPPYGKAADALALPEGTVTFLLSDIAGFTRQWERAGETFRQVVAIHHALLRQQFARHGGMEFKEVGDSFLVAFDRASDALACAIACQRALQQQVWPVEVGPLSVRMALHTGEATPEGNDYHGPVLNRASRLVTAAQGGQILCSETTVSLLQHPASDVPLYDLGLYRLRDMPNPEHLFQVNYPDMPQREFAAPNAEAGYTSSLPLILTRFFGRVQEKAQMLELLLDTETRLVTMTGMGGAGKTRLALEVARQLEEPFSGAVWFVPLAELSNANLIVPTIAAVLRLSPSPQVEMLDQVVTVLSRQPSLLILDNFEQLVEEGASFVQTLLARNPSLTLMITSRQVLRLSGEREFALKPFPVPGDMQTLEKLCLYESVQLFIDRAQAVKPDFRVTNHNAAAVATLCDRLEGIPLAIELAAARAQVLTPAQILAQLQNRSDLLASRRRDATDRHRTLQAAIEWSHRLLSPELQRFFARLSVFRGGWSAEAAEAVCASEASEEAGHGFGTALDALAQLRECSLVLAEESGEEIRFRMLETVREYAQDQLTHEERTLVVRRHRNFFLKLAEETQPKLWEVEQALWFERLEMEHDNLREALRLSVVSQTDTGLRLSITLKRFWIVRGHLAEGRQWYTALLAQEGAQARTSQRAQALDDAGALAYHQGDYAASRSLQEEGLSIRRELEDIQAIASSLNSLRLVAKEQGDNDSARAYAVECLALHREIGRPWGIGFSLFCLAGVCEGENGQAEQRAHYEEALAIFRAANHQRGIAYALDFLGNAASDRGAYAEASAHYLEALEILREANDLQGIALLLCDLAKIAVEQSDYALARTYLAESLLYWRTIGDRAGIARLLELHANLEQTQGQRIRAVGLWAAGEHLREEIGAPQSPPDREKWDRMVAPVRQALGDAAFASAWAGGWVMTLDQAVAYAFEEAIG